MKTWIRQIHLFERAGESMSVFDLIFDIRIKKGPSLALSAITWDYKQQLF